MKTYPCHDIWQTFLINEAQLIANLDMKSDISLISTVPAKDIVVRVLAEMIPRDENCFLTRQWAEWANTVKHLLVKHIEAETNGHHFADDIFKCIFLNENI